jgi:hypothetical protein
MDEFSWTWHAHYATEGYSIFRFFFPYVNSTIVAIVWTFEVEETQLSLSVVC